MECLMGFRIYEEDERERWETKIFFIVLMKILMVLDGNWQEGKRC